MDVYVDILFLVNFIVNYIILLISNKIIKGKSKYKLLLGAFLGACYSILLIIFPYLKFYTLTWKIIFSLLIVSISFNPKTISMFIKALATFYVSTFIFAGAAFYFMHTANASSFIKSGMICFLYNSKAGVLLASMIILACLLKWFWNVIQIHIGRNSFLVPLKVVFENKVANIEALIDTGNSVCAPLTNSPVVIVEFEAIKSILPAEVQSIFEGVSEIDLSSVTQVLNETDWFSRFRIVPFSSIGKDNGLLMGFKSDYVEIGGVNDVKSVKNATIGICNKALCKDRSYGALLSLSLI